MILITQANVIKSGRQLVVGEKVDIEIDKTVVVMDADTIVVYNLVYN